MSRNNKALAVGLVTLCLLGGCGSVKQKTVITSDDRAVEQISQAVVAETPQAYDEVENKDVPEKKETESKVEFDPIPMYEAFLNNEEVVKVSFAADQGRYSSFCNTLADGGSYSIDELIQGLKDGINDYFESDTEIEVKEIRHEYIDCGNDGQKELLVAIKLKEPVELFENKMIFKANENGIKLCYSSDSWSRKGHSVNEYGYITDRYYTGERFDRFEYSFVDADGNWHFLLGGNAISLTELDKAWVERNKSELENLEIDPDRVFLGKFYFEKPVPGEEPSYIKTEYVYDKYKYEYTLSSEKQEEFAKLTGLIESGGLLYTTDEYGELMNAIGVDTCSEVEMIGIVADKLGLEGNELLSGIQDGKEVLESDVDF